MFKDVELSDTSLKRHVRMYASASKCKFIVSIRCINRLIFVCHNFFFFAFQSVHIYKVLLKSNYSISFFFLSFFRLFMLLACYLYPYVVFFLFLPPPTWMILKGAIKSYIFILSRKCYIIVNALRLLDLCVR